MSASFSRLATETASTKRNPAIASGKRGSPATYLTGLRCTPLDPVDPEMRNRLNLDTPYELLQTFVVGAQDILEGDVLTLNGVDYPIRAVAEWPASRQGGDALRHLILEDLKQ